MIAADEEASSHTVAKEFASSTADRSLYPGDVDLARPSSKDPGVVLTGQLWLLCTLDGNKF